MIKSRLVCHPRTPCPAIEDFSAEMEADSTGNLHLFYRLSGESALIRIPEPQPPAATDGLWRYTCFEAFIAPEAGEAYREFNFSPSGQYAGYAFSRYRTRQEWFAVAPLSITFTNTDDSCTLQTVISAANLPVNMPDKAIRLGLSAVVELQDGSLSYWALHHPVGQPDFHHRDGLILSINGSEFA